MGSNIASLQSQRRLGENSALQAKSFERLSSGMRINRASDDAAGLAIASGLEVNSRIFTQAIRNLNDGISSLSITDSALQSLTDISIRQKELATQAATGSLSFKQRQAIAGEANALVEEFNRVVTTTTFNGVQLLANGGSSVSLQAGVGSQAVLMQTTGSSLGRTVGTGLLESLLATAVGTASANSSWTKKQLVAEDLNGDGKIDLLITNPSGNLFLLAGNGDGTFQNAATIAVGNGATIDIGDVNNDGNLDILLGSSGGLIRVFNGNGSGGFSLSSSVASAMSEASKFVDLNNDGFLDVITGNAFHLNNNGVLGAAQTTGMPTSFYSYELGDFNNDGRTDYVNDAGVYLRNASGGFSSVITFGASSSGRGLAVTDLNNDGFLDVIRSNGADSAALVYHGRGNGSFDLVASIAVANIYHISTGDMNSDGYDDLLLNNQIYLRNASGSYQAAASISPLFSPSSSSYAIADLNNDGVNDLVASDTNNNRIGLSQTTEANTIAQIDLFSQSAARETLDILDDQLLRISAERASIGAFMSRVDTAVRTLEASRESYAAARSRIVDISVADESAESIRVGIMQQTALSVLQQANIQPQIALKLLQ